MEAVPAISGTLGLACSAAHPPVQQLVPNAGPDGLALMRSSAAPRARPRPPALALPLGPESLTHFSFSEEDTLRHPPGRCVRWVACSQLVALLCDLKVLLPVCGKRTLSRVATLWGIP